MPARLVHIARVLRSVPGLLLDNGADLIAGSVADPGSRVVAATEETTSGRNRLQDDGPGPCMQLCHSTFRRDERLPD